MSALESFTTGFKASAGSLAGAGVPWLVALRQRAIDRFAQEGWPLTRQESWHHTSLALLDQQSFTQRGEVRTPTEVVRSLRGDEAGHWVVFVDGRYSPGLSDVGSLPSGVRISALSEALSTNPDEIQVHLGDESNGSSSEALNLALADDGICIHVARATQVELPIHAVFITVSKQVANFTRNVIVLDNGAQATLVEHFVNDGDSASFSNSVLRVALAPDAQFVHLKLQQESEQAFHLGVSDIAQQQGSKYTSHSMSFGARLSRHDINTHFNGEHCETLLNGLYYVNGKRHVDNHTYIDHASPNGFSREYYRGILADTARGVFGGRIRVAPMADGTDAVQRTDSLLLSRMARADARPELEIYAEEVKCAHGATVGALDEESMFYLRSRGLDESHARGILIYAFAAQAIDRIASKPLQQRVTRAIRSLLPGSERLGDMAL